MSEAMQFTQSEKDFQFAVSTELKGVSISYESGYWECRSSEHDDGDRISGKEICRLVDRYDLEVYYPTGHYGTGELIIYVYDPGRTDPWGDES